jgi:hypothetical protein
MKIIITYPDKKNPETMFQQLIDVYDIKLSSSTDKFLLLYTYIDKSGEEKESWTPMEYDPKTKEYYNQPRLFSEYPQYLPQTLPQEEKDRIMDKLSRQGIIERAETPNTPSLLPIYFSEKGTLYLRKKDIEKIDWRPLSYETADFGYCELLGYELATLKRKYHIKTIFLPLTSKEQKKTAEEDSKAKRKNEIIITLFPQSEMYPLGVFYDVEGYGDPTPYSTLPQDQKEIIRTATGKKDPFLVGATKEEFTPEVFMEYLKTFDKIKGKLDTDVTLVCGNTKRNYAGSDVQKMYAVSEILNAYYIGTETKEAYR